MSFQLQLTVTFAVTVLAVGIAAALVKGYSPTWKRKRGDNEIHVAFLGNSILYFNDCPRLVQHMLLASQKNYQRVVQDSCLRGGASLTSLLEQGNGMRHKFAVPHAADGRHDIGAPTVVDLLSTTCNHDWDFCVLNDYTQAPTRPTSRDATIQSLMQSYIPLFQKHNITPVLLQTFAYRIPNMRGTSDLGDTQQFTQSLVEGYREYQRVLQEHLGDCRVAPVGEAFLWIHRYNRDLFDKLYSWDDFHPSPHGTWLQACVLVCTLTRSEPPRYNPLWWNECRYMQPPNEKPLPLPTVQEAEELRLVACSICGIEASNGRKSQL